MGEPLHRRTLNHERSVHSHHVRARVALQPVLARVHDEEQSHRMGVRAKLFSHEGHPWRLSWCHVPHTMTLHPLKEF